MATPNCLDAMGNIETRQSKLPPIKGVDRLVAMNEWMARRCYSASSVSCCLIAIASLLLLTSAALSLADDHSVIPGIEVLLSEQMRLIRGKRVGLITNHTGVDRRLRHDIDLLASAPGVNLTALFSPEHGIRGAAQAGEKVRSTIDAETGVPIHSLYGEIRRPTPEMLKDVEVLIYDIQDIGSRFYTYISTLGECLQAA